MIFNNNDLPVRLLTLMLAALMCTSMSGCRGTAGAESSQTENTLLTEYHDRTVENTENNLSQSNESTPTDFFTEYGKPLPNDIKFGEIQNMLVINKKNIGLPINLSEFSNLIDGLSYEVDKDFVAEYGSETAMLESTGLLPVLLNYNDNFFYRSFIEKRDFNDTIDNSSIRELGFLSKNNDSLSVSTTFGIDFSSTTEDVQKIFGEPSMIMSHNKLVYYFIDSTTDNKCKLTFSFNEETGIISGISIYCG